MDAVALVVEENFPELHSCFSGTKYSSLPVATTSDVARVHITSDALNDFRELAALESLAVLEGPACELYRVAMSPEMRSKSKMRPPTSL